MIDIDVSTIAFGGTAATLLWAATEFGLRKFLPYKDVPQDLKGSEEETRKLRNILAFNAGARKSRGNIRLGLAALSILIVIGYIFSGGFWTTGPHDVSVDNEIPREAGRIEYRTAPAPDVTGDGRDIQEEAFQSLDDFRRERLDQGDDQ